ncbi:hypothetical protein C3K47_08225 [Solitalea longa]|uniref:PKD domain-containing protein n=1 Tax=Solitalea longa TaxID=2079460 RepID=A0A2S5A3E0_9SPHI|nr:gliding motility-associated C-terminal domain-containing protein [Solitalea longa]POY37034.1 hypothetical protein C3K47_08225 [Solitalea longa]
MHSTRYFIHFLIFTLVLIWSNVYAQQPDLLWGRSLGGIYNDAGSSLTNDQYGNTYICGSFRDVVNFGVPPNNGTLTSNGDADVYFAKYDINGNLVWAKSIGSYDWDEGHTIAIGKEGNVYISGFMRETADFDPGPSTSILSAASGSPDIFIAAYDNQGNYLWAHLIGNSSLDMGQNITTDKEGNVYLAGLFSGQVDFNPSSGTLILGDSKSSQDAFIAKFDSKGNVLWAHNIGENYNTNQAVRIRTDLNGNVSITGDLRGSADFDPSPTGVDIKSSNGDVDGFISKYDKNGNYLWSHSIGGSSLDRCASFDYDLDGNIYLSGLYTGTVDFDPSSSIYNLTASGEFDSYIVKYDPNGKFIWAKSFGGSGKTYLHNARLDKDGNFYGAGGFSGTVDFDAGPGVSKGVNPNYGYDVFLIKYDKDGKFIWNRVINGSSDYDFSYSMDVDQAGNISMIGNFNSTIDLDPSNCVFNVSSTNYYGDIFFAKYTQNNNDLANILTFSVPEQVEPAIINSSTQTVTLKVKTGTNVSSLTPTITIPSCSVINPNSGVSQNFSAPVKYVVTDKFNQSKTWTVYVIFDDLPVVSCSYQFTPIQIIDFGTEGNPKLLSGSTTYTINQSNNPVESYGFYSTIPTHTNPQWLIGPDHSSGDNSGRMAIYNASEKAGELVRIPFPNLCPESVYRFSAFVANIVDKSNECTNGNPVNLRFEVLDKYNKIIASSNTGDITSSNKISWSEYGVNFSGQSEATLIIKNNGKGDCGNDLAIDDISISVCGSLTLNSTVNPGKNEVIVCEGTDVLVNSNLNSDLKNPAFLWQSSVDSLAWTDLTGETKESIEFKNPKTSDSKYYRLLTGSNSVSSDPLENCKLISNTIRLIVNTNPEITVDDVKPICIGSSTVLRLNSTKGRTYQWFENNTPLNGAINDTLKVTKAGDYFLRVYQDDNCSRDSKIITIKTTPKPVAKFMVTSNCDGSFNFTNQSEISDKSSLTYYWNFGDTGSSSNNSISPNAVHTYSSPGVKKVLLTVTSNNDCVDTISQSFNILGAGVSASFLIQSQEPYCSKEPIKFINDSKVLFGIIDSNKWEITDSNGKVIYTSTSKDEIEFTAPKLPNIQQYKIKLTAGTGNCYNSIVKAITIFPSPEVSFKAPFPVVCINSGVYTFTEGQPQTSDFSYEGDGVTNNSFDPMSAGSGDHLITYKIVDNNGCEGSVEQTISVTQLPQIVCKDYTVIKDVDVSLDVELLNRQNYKNFTYKWSPEIGLSNPNIKNPILHPTSNTSYTITVTSPEGCSASCDIEVKVLEKIVIPNVFTPNNDGINDLWVIKGLESFPSVQVFVYNRFGGLVFSSNGYSKPWTGTVNNKYLPPSTYYYVIKPNKQEFPTITGSVTIIY